MGRFLVKIKERYVLWSTVVDAPVNVFKDKAHCRAELLVEWGRVAELGIDEAIATCDERGVSSRRYTDVKDAVSYNRAGKNETSLSFGSLERLIEQEWKERYA